jgi:hypothetical protein
LSPIIRSFVLHPNIYRESYISYAVFCLAADFSELLIGRIQLDGLSVVSVDQTLREQI